MIFSVRIFCRSCLTANLDSGNSSRPTGSAQYGVAHTFRYYVIIFRIDSRITFLCIKRIQRGILYFFNHMRCDKITPVGDRCRQVTYLQRRCGYFSLPYRNRDDRAGVPAPVQFIVHFTVRYVSSFFTRQVNPQRIAIPHRHQMILPDLKAFLNSGIPATVIQHIMQSPAKKGVTRGSQSRNKT